MAISMKHKSITIDVNDRNAPNVVAIANVNDKYVVTEIKQTPPKFEGQKWKRTFEFEGDLAALQMLNRYMDVIRSINPTFSFGEVKLTEKELSDPQTGSINKYSVKEIN